MKKIHLFLLAVMLSPIVAFSQVIFSTPGTYNWTVPPCVYEVTVET